MAGGFQEQQESEPQCQHFQVSAPGVRSCSTGCNKPQGQARFRKLRKTPPPDGRGCKVMAQGISIGTGGTFGHLCKHATHSQAYVHTVFLVISHWKEHAICLGRELGSAFLICLATFQLHLYYCRRGKWILVNTQPSLFQEFCLDCQVWVCRGLYPLVLPPVKPERASASPTECVIKFIDFSLT